MDGLPTAAAAAVAKSLLGIVAVAAQMNGSPPGGEGLSRRLVRVSSRRLGLRSPRLHNTGNVRCSRRFLPRPSQIHCLSRFHCVSPENGFPAFSRHWMPVGAVTSCLFQHRAPALPLLDGRLSRLELGRLSSWRLAHAFCLDGCRGSA